MRCFCRAKEKWTQIKSHAKVDDKNGRQKMNIEKNEMKFRIHIELKFFKISGSLFI